MRALILAMLMALGCSQSNAAEIKHNDLGIITLEGRITPGDGARMENAIRASIRATYKPGQPTIVIIGFDSPGGQLDAANDVSKAMIRFHRMGGKLITVVPDGAQCNSACVLLFAIGDGRGVWGEGIIGVHRSRDAETHSEDAGSHEANGVMAAGLAKWGAPMSVIRKLLGTAADDMTALDAGDFAAWGVKVMKCKDDKGWRVC